MSFDVLESRELRPFHRKLTALSAAGMFLDGFDLTVIAVALPLLAKQWSIPPSLSGLVAASAVIGMLVGSLFLGHLTDRIGRKAMYLFDLAFFVVFAGLTAASQNVWELLLFRFLLGLGIGADYPISSTLLAEFVPAKSRGSFVTLLGATWFLGAVCAYLAGLALLPLGAAAWRWMLLIGAVIALVVIFFRASIPESPRWLASRGRTDEAADVLRSLGDGHTGVQRIAPRAWTDMFSKELIRSTVFVAGFWFCYDVAFYGISIYTPTILKNFTTGSASAAYLGSAIVSLLGLVGALIGVALVDRWGRRPLILFSFAGLTVLLAALAVEPSPALAMLVVLFGLATLFANMGPGVLDFVYPTEIFPTGVRAGATGFGTAVSRVGAILSILVFPGLVQSLGLQAALWLFVAASAAGLVICFALAPETKGRALEDLSEPAGVSGTQTAREPATAGVA
ncbi:MAG TPA: MFS transporter [Candidatus Dormibacteraeota bacterium]|nr:MFS transporter [Candidatus Dormibacteraeota bacterium]